MRILSATSSDEAMKYWVMIMGMICCMAQGHAQNHHSRQAKDALDEFRKSVYEDFNNFRKECMEEFVEFMRNPWKEFEETKPVPMPDEKPVPPVVMPKDDEDKPIEDKPVVIDEVVKPQPVEPQPQPVEPIEEVPVTVEKTVDFTFFGTTAKVRFDTSNRVPVNGLDENSIADAMGRFTPQAYDNMMIDCLSLRDNLHLCDWAYLQMLNELTATIAGKNTNEAALLLAYLYMQSGYRMRLGTDGTRLYMLFASKHQIFERGSFDVDNESYYGIDELPSRMYICQAAFPKEKSLSLLVPNNPQLADRASEKRAIVSKKYPTVKMSVSVNKNLIDFYNTYPTSIVDDNFMTRWSMYADTPLERSVRNQTYAGLKEQLKGLTQLEAVNRLLNLVQTGFVYEYDDKVWGNDRAFFAEESLYYPYCDCEDRSILFTRLVRDLVGLDCILVFYPGHLASAVCFTEEAKGDYIMLGTKRFVIADPTYIGAPVGITMPDMDNKSAKVILLKK